MQEASLSQPLGGLRASESGASPSVAPLFVNQSAPRQHAPHGQPLVGAASGKQLSGMPSGMALSGELPLPSGFLSELPLEGSLPPAGPSAVPQPFPPATAGTAGGAPGQAQAMAHTPVLMWVAPVAPAQADGNAMLFTMTPAAELPPDSWPLFVQNGAWAAGVHAQCVLLGSLYTRCPFPAMFACNVCS